MRRNGRAHQIRKLWICFCWCNSIEFHHCKSEHAGQASPLVSLDINDSERWNVDGSLGSPFFVRLRWSHVDQQGFSRIHHSLSLLSGNRGNAIFLSELPLNALPRRIFHEIFFILLLFFRYRGSNGESISIRGSSWSSIEQAPAPLHRAGRSTWSCKAPLVARHDSIHCMLQLLEGQNLWNK